MTIVGGFDVHRKQITFDYVDDDGLVRVGEIRPATRTTLRHWLSAAGAGRQVFGSTARSGGDSTTSPISTVRRQADLNRSISDSAHRISRRTALVLLAGQAIFGEVRRAQHRPQHCAKTGAALVFGRRRLRFDIECGERNSTVEEACSGVIAAEHDVGRRNARPTVCTSNSPRIDHSVPRGARHADGLHRAFDHRRRCARGRRDQLACAVAHDARCVAGRRPRRQQRRQRCRAGGHRGEFLVDLHRGLQLVVFLPGDDVEHHFVMAMNGVSSGTVNNGTSLPLWIVLTCGVLFGGVTGTATATGGFSFVAFLVQFSVAASYNITYAPTFRTTAATCRGIRSRRRSSRRCSSAPPRRRRG